MEKEGELLSRMRPEQDLEYIYPITDCTACGKSVPFGLAGPFLVDMGVIRIQYCLNCGQTPSQEVKTKGYVSLLDLEEMGLGSNL